MMKPEVIGVTTEYANIAKILGVENENEYGLYQETKMGKYYARILPNGTFDRKVVRLISCEQAAQLNSSICTAIKEAGKKVQKIIDSTPIIDMEQLNKSMEDVHRQSKARAEKIGADIRTSLESAGFHPTYSNN